MCVDELIESNGLVELPTITNLIYESMLDHDKYLESLLTKNLEDEDEDRANAAGDIKP